MLVLQRDSCLPPYSSQWIAEGQDNGENCRQGSPVEKVLGPSKSKTQDMSANCFKLSYSADMEGYRSERIGCAQRLLPSPEDAKF